MHESIGKDKDGAYRYRPLTPQSKKQHHPTSLNSTGGQPPEVIQRLRLQELANKSARNGPLNRLQQLAGGRAESNRGQSSQGLL